MASDELDLYGNIEEDFVEESHDVNELYDDAVGTTEKDNNSDSPRSTRIVTINSENNDSYSGPRIASYVGNLTWWTTDDDMLEALSSIGINDILQIKFHENRMNGQSKGFCVVVLASYQSVEIAREKLPAMKIHGRKPVIANCNKRNLQLFDQYAQESSNGGSDYEKTSFNPADFTRNNQLGNSLGGGSFRNAVRESGLSTGRSDSSVSSRQQSSQQQSLPTSMRLGPAALAPTSLSVPPPGFGASAAALNPQQAAFMAAQQQQLGASAASLQLGLVPNLSTMRPPAVLGMPGFPPGLMAAGLKPEHQTIPNLFANVGAASLKLNEMEFEENLQKNKTIASSAINRAVQDAAAGQFASAIETLVTAISLVKQSKIAGDDRCKILINTLQETLSGIESRSYTSKGRGSGRRRRSYSGSDSDDDYRRGSRHHRRRSRSRSRDRDRYESKHRRSSPSRGSSSRDDHHRSGGGGSSSSSRVEYYGGGGGGGSAGSGTPGGLMGSSSLNNILPSNMNNISAYRGGSGSFRQ